jgi:hypothetical protein
MPLNRSKTIIAPKGKPPMMIKTPLAREFEADLSNRLLEYGEDIGKFRKKFKDKENYIDLEFFAYCPPNELFTKNGSINSKCPDFDSNKLMIDVIFKGIGINDKYVKEANIKYLQSYDEYWNFVILLHIRKVENLKLEKRCLKEELL